MITDRYDFENSEDTKRLIMRELELLINNKYSSNEFKLFRVRFALEEIND